MVSRYLGSFHGRPKQRQYGVASIHSLSVRRAWITPLVVVDDLLRRYREDKTDYDMEHWWLKRKVHHTLWFRGTMDLRLFNHEFRPPTFVPGFRDKTPCKTSVAQQTVHHSRNSISHQRSLSKRNRAGSLGFWESRLSCVHVCDYMNMCPMPNIRAAHYECRKRRIILGWLSSSCARLTPHVFGCSPPIRQLTLHDSSNSTIKANVILSFESNSQDTAEIMRKGGVWVSGFLGVARSPLRETYHTTPS